MRLALEPALLANRSALASRESIKRVLADATENAMFKPHSSLGKSLLQQVGQVGQAVCHHVVLVLLCYGP